MNREDDSKNLFGMCDEMSIIKYPQFLKFNGHSQHDDDDYEIVGNQIFIFKEFVVQFIIGFKMYDCNGMYKLKIV
jgi:hypothetical protein